LKLLAHTAGLPGKVISFYIVPLYSAYPAGDGARSGQDETVSALDKYRLKGRVRRTIKAAQMIEKERPRASVSKP